MFSASRRRTHPLSRAKLLMSQIICIQEHIVVVSLQGLFMRVINAQLIGIVASPDFREWPRVGVCSCVFVSRSHALLHTYFLDASSDACFPPSLPACLPARALTPQTGTSA